MKSSRDQRLRLILTVFWGLAALKAGAVFFPSSPEKPWQESLQLITALFLLMPLVVLVSGRRKLDAGSGALGKGLASGTALWIAGCFFLLLNWLSLPQEAEWKAYRLLAFLAGCFFTALFEEVWCRGLILNQCLLIWAGKEKKRWDGRFSAVLCSAAVFAGLHLLNLIERPYFLLGTGVQVIYTFCLGMLLGVIYVMTGSLWSVVFLHGWFNAAGSFPEAAAGLAAGTPSDLSPASALIQLCLMLPVGAGAVWIYRKTQRTEKRK